MSKRPYKPQGIPTLSPYVMISNPDESMAFYKKAFGFRLGQNPPLKMEGNIMHFEMTYNDALLMFGRTGVWEKAAETPNASQQMSPIGLYLYVEDIDAFVKAARENGAEVVSEPENAFWGDRMARLKDPDGYVWTFATNVGDFDPSKVPTSAS